MHKDVLRIFKNKTMHKDRLSVLDALLKLRQVCRDPRLLREDLRKGVNDEAEIEHRKALSVRSPALLKCYLHAMNKRNAFD